MTRTLTRFWLSRYHGEISLFRFSLFRYRRDTITNNHVTYMGRKVGGRGLCPLLGEAESPSTQCGLGRNLPSYQVASWSIQPFGHSRHGLKIWGSMPLFGGEELGPHVRQCSLGQGLPPYQVASWSFQSLGHNRYGPKIGGCAPLGEGSWVPI